MTFKFAALNACHSHSNALLQIRDRIFVGSICVYFWSVCGKFMKYLSLGHDDADNDGVFKSKVSQLVLWPHLS